MKTKNVGHPITWRDLGVWQDGRVTLQGAWGLGFNSYRQEVGPRNNLTYTTTNILTSYCLATKKKVYMKSGARNNIGPMTNDTTNCSWSLMHLGFVLNLNSPYINGYADRLFHVIVEENCPQQHKVICKSPKRTYGGLKLSPCILWALKNRFLAAPINVRDLNPTIEQTNPKTYPLNQTTRWYRCLIYSKSSRCHTVKFKMPNARFMWSSCDCYKIL